MTPDLIFHVGAHIGDDTESYLAKGFPTVAIEAHLGGCTSLRNRLAGEITSGRLDLINIAVAERPGLVKLLESQTDSQWSTTDAAVADSKPGDFRPITVPAIPFAGVFETLGVRYYVKIDIEGVERHVLKHLQRDCLPRHISFEVNSEWEAFISHLQGLGCARLKLVNQARLHEELLPTPAREGRLID